MNVSIHAPSRGATSIVFPSTDANLSFNPRTLTGCDASWKRLRSRQTCFNPRTLTGCDIEAPTIDAAAESFNPRTLTGCDNTALWCSYRAASFQSTHPHGVRRRCVNKIGEVLKVSIHAPSRGATGSRRQNLSSWVRFNPRTLTGCDV